MCVPFLALKLEIRLFLLAEAFSPDRLCSVGLGGRGGEGEKIRRMDRNGWRKGLEKWKKDGQGEASSAMV